jgi:hypothetical protein
MSSESLVHYSTLYVLKDYGISILYDSYKPDDYYSSWALGTKILVINLVDDS